MSWECACGVTNKDTASKCGGCGWTRAQLKDYLEGQARGRTVVNVATTTSPVKVYVLVGFIIGSLVAFMFRPSLFLVGQLPFITVLTRGVFLEGIDAILIPAAQTSFNYMLVGGILGAILGGVLGTSLAKKSVSTGGPDPETRNGQTSSVLVAKNYCGYCGAALAVDAIFCPKCGRKCAPS